MMSFYFFFLTYEYGGYGVDFYGDIWVAFHFVIC